MGSLSDWARRCEIDFAEGVELMEDVLGDWSLSTKTSIRRGDAILTVPARVILSSDIKGDNYDPYYSEEDMENISMWMNSELESGSQAKQDYLPEYLLVYKLMREVCLGSNSRWYEWVRSLPVQFSTGLYLDEVEHNLVKRMTGDYLVVQEKQYQDCLNLFRKLISTQDSKSKGGIVPADFFEWMTQLNRNSDETASGFDDLIKWAFSIVFTRSWRSPDMKHAQMVPVGDLANHDSQMANLKPGFREVDGAFQFFVTNNIDASGNRNPLYLSYGLTYAPARYLVLFGFCDVTAGFIDANLDFLPDIGDDIRWPTLLEPSQLVISTSNGALSEEVWVAFLYKVLQEKEPNTLSMIENAFEGGNQKRGDKILEQILDDWEWDVGNEIQSYYEKLLSSDFAPIFVEEKDLVKHPNLSMIINYNMFIRETYLGALKHVDEFLSQCQQFQEMASAKTYATDSKPLKSSVLHFQNHEKYKSPESKEVEIALEPICRNTSESSVLNNTRVGSERNYTQTSSEANYTNLLETQPTAFHQSDIKSQKAQSTQTIAETFDRTISRNDVMEQLDQTLEFNDSIDQTRESQDFFDQTNGIQDSVDQTDGSSIGNDQTNFLKSLYGKSIKQGNSFGWQQESLLDGSSKIVSPDLRPSEKMDALDDNSTMHPIDAYSPQYNASSAISGQCLPSDLCEQQYDSTLGSPSEYRDENLQTDSLYRPLESNELVESFDTEMNSSYLSPIAGSNAFGKSSESLYGVPTSANFQDGTSGFSSYPNSGFEQNLNATDFRASDQPTSEQSDSVNSMKTLSEGDDPVTSYTRSLVSDQRGKQDERQRENIQEAPAAATTYAEYLKQRQHGLDHEVD